MGVAAESYGLYIEAAEHKHARDTRTVFCMHKHFLRQLLQHDHQLRTDMQSGCKMMVAVRSDTALGPLVQHAKHEIRTITSAINWSLLVDIALVVLLAAPSRQRTNGGS